MEHFWSYAFIRYLNLKYGRITVEGLHFDASRVLYELDPDAYTEHLNAWREKMTEQHLDLIKQFHPDSYDRLIQLEKHIKTKHDEMCLFLGAGVSCSVRLPGWKEFLENMIKSKEAQGIQASVETDMITYKYEKVAQVLASIMGTEVFNEKIGRTFGKDIDVASFEGWHLLLPQLKINRIITTNFDKVIELVYKRITGKAVHTFKSFDCEEFFDSSAGGDVSLLKIHGDARSMNMRVLTSEEYNHHYGERLDFTKPLPKTLRTIYSSNTILFIGCSLEHDRTFDVFKDIATTIHPKKHYAILDVDDHNLTNKQAQLLQASIHPIFIPKGKFEYIPSILHKLGK